MDFNEQFKLLNQDQQKAVEEIFGPLLVMAGPGSGKTQVLSMRIANILKKTDSKAKNILALTFTENASLGMRQRLLSLIGPEAFDVGIFTFHSFAYEIINHYPEKFLFASKLELADELVKLKLLQNILKKENFKHLSPLYAPNFFITNIISKISDLKREGIKAKKFLQIIAQEKEIFDSIDEDEKINSKTGKIKHKFLDKSKKIEKWQELGHIFLKLETKMQKNGLFDFDDLILLVLEKLSNDSDLLCDLQEKYLFFLVDEFQDSNGAQFSLLKKILEKDHPNFFAVGDVDQSIYRFQGANLENILLFSQSFPQTKILSLGRNYRSSENIVNFSASLIAKNTENAKIISKKENYLYSDKKGPLPQFLQFKEQSGEEYYIVSKIKDLLKAGSKCNEIAIIFRKNSEGVRWQQILEKNKIEVFFEDRGSFFKNIKIRQFLILINLIKNPHLNEDFFKVLHFDFLNIPLVLIWQKWQELKIKKQTFWDNILLKVKDNQLNFKAEKENALISFEKKFYQWQADLHNLSLDNFLKKVAQESGLLKKLLNAEKNFDFKTLQSLKEIFKQAENTFLTQGDLEQFIENLKIKEEFNLKVTTKSIKEKGIRLFTAHASKGLEFKHVFIPNLSRGSWGDLRLNDPLKLPSSILSMPHEEKNLEEERRLFYVALTRAKENLWLCFHQNSHQGKEKIISRFISEIDQNLFEKKEKSFSKQDLINFQFNYLKQDLSFSLNQEISDFIKQKIKSNDFALSHTAFENFRLCMRKGFLENILYAPRQKNAALAIGSSIHKGLEVFFKTLQKEKIFPSISIVQKVFVNYLQKEKIEKEEKEKLILEGKEILEKFLQNQKENYFIPFLVEADLRSHQILLHQKVPLTGKIDLIAFNDKQKSSVQIIDFKVTKSKSSEQIKGTRPSDLKNPQPETGVLYRQLIFFALLLQKSKQFNLPIEKFVLQFLRPEKNNDFISREFQPSMEEIKNLEKEILIIWEKIQNLQFNKLSLTEKDRVCQKCGGGGNKCPFFEICWE